MDIKVISESIDNTDTKLTLLTVDIKSEPEDHPELVQEADLISDNYCAEKVDSVEEVLETNSNLTTNEQYSCSQCNEKFPELKYIQVHEAVHDPNLHCPVCDRIFRSEKYFVPHIEVHLKDPIRCQQCPEIFFDKRSYNLHLYTHKKSKTYVCDYCSKEWSTKKDLTVHIRVHTNERPYSCVTCGKSFKQKGGLSSHMSSLHSSKERVIREKISCSVCNGTYSSVSSLNKHMKKVHEIGKTFPCSKCGLAFLNFQQMKDHRKESHPELAYNRICSLCNQIFSCRESFEKHQHVHNETGEQMKANSFAASKPCYLCGEQISGMTAFSKHQQFHLLMTDDELEASIKANKFTCKVCNRQFNVKRNLFKHMDTHLEKKFECKSHCSEKFTYLGIRLHLEWFFDEFYCAECDKTFIGRRSLKKHYQKHKTTIQFACKICGYNFKYKRLLITHWKMQHNLKCQSCFKKFDTHLEFRRHIKMKHKVNIPNGLATVIKRTSLENIRVKVDSQLLRKYNCKLCKYSAETMHLLRDHMKIHKKKCYQCDNCKKHFLYYRNWMFHIRQNICLKYFNNTKGTSHLNCLVCEKEFGSVLSLMNHIRRHNAIHKCKFCNSTFKLKDLQEHINRQHPGEGELSCDGYSHKTMLIKVETEENATECSRDLESNENGDVFQPDGHLVWIKQECTN